MTSAWRADCREQGESRGTARGPVREDSSENREVMGVGVFGIEKKAKQTC